MAADIFTTIAKVKRAAGCQDNTNVDDTLDVTPTVDRANYKMRQAIGNRYQLPLNSISGYTGSELEKGLVETATQLGSCYLRRLLYEGQGGDIMDTTEAICDQAFEELNKLADGDEKIKLDDGTELPLEEGASNSPSGFPLNSDLEDTSDPVNIPAFTTQDVF